MCDLRGYEVSIEASTLLKSRVEAFFVFQMALGSPVGSSPQVDGR